MYIFLNLTQNICEIYLTYLHTYFYIYWFLIEPRVIFQDLRDYANSLDLRDMFTREIERRYNKAWFKEINPNAKNYNQNQEYDSKFAAHLFRVLNQAAWYIESGNLYTRSVGLDIREAYLSIKSGITPKDDVLSITSDLRVAVLADLQDMGEKSEREFPIDTYFRAYENMATKSRY